MHLFGEKIDERLKNALNAAKEWIQGNVSVGDARNASLGTIAIARESSNPTAITVARSVGHAVATAHMAEHSLGGAIGTIATDGSMSGTWSSSIGQTGNWMSLSGAAT